MTPRKRNLITGVVVLAALGTLVWMILTFSGRLMGLFKPRGTVVEFQSDRGDGLSDGSPVYYRGVQVGKVTRVRRSADNIHVQITGEVDNHPPLPGNIVGIIKSQSQLSSSSQIELRLEGEPKGELNSKDPIKIRYQGLSIFPPEVTDFIAQVQRQQLVDHVDKAIISLQAQVEKAGLVMESVQKLIGDEKLQNDIRQTMVNVRQTTERANKITANLETLTSNANGTMTEIRTTVAKTNENVDKLTLKIDTDLDKLGIVFTQFQEVVQKINAGKGTAGALLNDPKLYDEMATTAKELNVVATSLARLVDQWEHEGVALKLAK